MKQNKKTQNGFALIATILLMVLLAIITVGMLSLSVVTLRTANQDSAQASARANARMALMIAIGELQKQMGPDQRISANSAILDASTVQHSHWLGVWNSWKAGVGESSQHSTIQGVTDNMAPSYLPNRSDYFRKWLVSLNENEMANISSPKTLSLSASHMPGPSEDAIFLVADGSLGEGDEKKPDYVAARILEVKDKGTSEVIGRYSWWIGDESQKARIMDDSFLPPPAPATAPTLTSADKIYRSQAPASMGTNTISGLKDVTVDSQFAALPSLATLDLVTGAKDRPAQQNFYDATPFSFSILTDVREGGMKRDLSTILEQPISRTNSGNEYMLYTFDDPRWPNDRSHSRVPIQDLAAYYQLYNDIKPTETGYDVNGREGVRYTSTQLAGAIQVNVPDFDGGAKVRQRSLREYTTLYKQPVVTKFQYLLALGAQPITQLDRDNITGQNNGTVPAPSGPGTQALVPVPDTDTHRLRIGVMPVVTLWNPSNMPMVMDRAQVFRVSNAPPIKLQWRKYRTTPSTAAWRNGSGTSTAPTPPNTYVSAWFSPGFLHNAGIQAFGFGGGFAFVEMVIAGTTTVPKPVVFQPGEVKTFSLVPTFGAKLNGTGNVNGIMAENAIRDTVEGYDPYGFFIAGHSAPYGGSGACPDIFFFTNGPQKGATLVFNKDDKFSLFVDKEADVGGWASGERVSPGGYVRGSGFALTMVDPGFRANVNDYLWWLDHYSMLSRHGGTNTAAIAFNNGLIAPGFPGGTTPIAYDVATNAISGSQIIGASEDTPPQVRGLMEFSLSLGCEAGSLSAGGYGGGRRIASRPFLHSGLGAPPFIDQFNKASLYNYGWDWQLSKVNDIEDSIIQAEPVTGNGFFGGGYTIEAGTTRVVQQEIPVLPAISIAALSPARLGGFSLGNSNNVGDDPLMTTLFVKGWRVNSPIGNDYQKTTATGHGGLAPNVLQSVGNSYAHPNIPANLAFTTWTRRFDGDVGEGDKIVPFVDHSYLANKALWDEFYFSSIAPQLSVIPLYRKNPNIVVSTKTAKDVAFDFFQLSGTSPSTPLPNRRIVPYKTNLDQAKLDTLFTEASVYTNGLADKIAARLMVEGGFNINCTSVNAWKIFLSSLKGKPVAYLDGGTVPKEVTPAGTTISPGILPNGVPVKSADITDINEPKEQWTSGRELSDDEINELSIAMVKQVKLRGPFLSMSEFVNRRLEGNTGAAAAERSVKGALQAALDDPTVSINAKFRTPSRILDAEVDGTTVDGDPSLPGMNPIPFAFPDAAKGPVAYGSMAYVDQADVLRGFAEQLTPRGDTFVIRTYGDSLDASGKVVARAWCEAVVQRVPEYVDSLDESHVKSANLASNRNKIFGRKIQIISFRWINPSEI